MRILALIEAFSITGPAKNLLEFAAHAPGVELTIVSFVRGPETNLFLDTARQAGITVEPIRERGQIDRAVPPALRSVAERIRPDIIQTHAVKSHFLARWSGLPAMAPWIAFHHGYTWPALRVRLYNQLDRWSLRTAQRVVTVSRPFRDELAARGVDARRIEIVHNSIRTDWGAGSREQAPQLRARLGIPADRKVILLVGRLSREKDHATLLRSAARLAGHNVHVLLVGDGPERGAIEQEMASLGLQDRVTFTGQQSSAEPYYGIADVAVLSSRSEGSPNALLEAMAVGVPVVATRVGGIPEIVADGESALLVPVSDAQAMSAAIGNLLSDRELAARLVEKSQALIREKHSPQARAARLLEIYRSVQAQPRAL